MNLDFWSLVFVITSFQIAFLIALILLKGAVRSNHLWLILLLSVILLIQIESLIKNTNLLYQVPHLLFIQYPLYYLIGPLLYFYIKSWLEPLSLKKYEIPLHLIPATVSLIYNSDVFLLGADEKIRYMEYFLSGQPTSINLSHLTVRVLINAGYLIFCMREINKKQTIYSKQELLWPRVIVYVFISNWIIYSLAIISLKVTLTYSVWITYFRLIGFTSITFIIYYLMVIRPRYFVSLNIVQWKTVKEGLQGSANQPAVNNFTPSINQEHLTRLVNQVEINKLYLDPSLSIQKLSSILGITRHEISRLVNHGLNKRFHEFINEYRVSFAKQKLTDPKYHYLSIDGIARECGFKSKSTFYKAFKSLTGLTPKAYQKKIKVELM